MFIPADWGVMVVDLRPWFISEGIDVGQTLRNQNNFRNLTTFVQMRRIYHLLLSFFNEIIDCETFTDRYSIPIQ